MTNNLEALDKDLLKFNRALSSGSSLINTVSTRSLISKAVIACILGVGLRAGPAESATIVVTTPFDSPSSGCTFNNALTSIDLQTLQFGCSAIGNFGTNDRIEFSDQLERNAIRKGTRFRASNQVDLTIDASNINGGIWLEGTPSSRGIVDLQFLSDNSTIELIDISVRGRVLLNGTSELSMSNCTVTENKPSSNATPSGAIDVSEGVVTLNRCTITNNRGPRSGGIFLEKGATAKLYDSEISNNTTQDGVGAGIYAKESKVFLYRSSVVGNSAKRSGGGIYMRDLNSPPQSVLVVEDSIISNNSAGEIGGGIFVRATPATITKSTISSNTASEFAGGIGIDPAGSSNYDLSLVSSTVANNQSYSGAGGVYASAGIIQNSTISGNTVTKSGDGYGGGIVTFGTTGLVLSNSTIANNTASRGGGLSTFYNAQVNIDNTIIANSTSILECDQGGGTQVFTNASSIIEDGSCGTSRAIDPGLALLSNNGGPTKTHALLPDSPARNTGTEASCPLTDQRGRPREDSQCDVGAFEFRRGDEPTQIFVIPAGEKTVVIPL